MDVLDQLLKKVGAARTDGGKEKEKDGERGRESEKWSEWEIERGNLANRDRVGDEEQGVRERKGVG